MIQHHDGTAAAMEPNDTSGEVAEPIDYDAPQVLEQIDIEAQLTVVIS